MRRVLFYVGSVPVYAYAAMLYVGTVCGIYVELYVATLIQVDPGRVLAATVLLFASALAGARLLFVISHWEYYRGDIRRMARSSEGGASMYGGLLVAVPLSPFLLAKLGIPLGAFWDLASFTLLVGMIFTRIGCLLNGCCCGRPTDGWLGLELADHRGVRVRRIPTQLLEAGWAATVLVGGLALWDIGLPFSGSLFLYSLGTYSLGRIVLEKTRQRQDCVRSVLLHSAISVGFVIISLGAFMFEWLN